MIDDRNDLSRLMDGPEEGFIHRQLTRLEDPDTSAALFADLFKAGVLLALFGAFIWSFLS